PRGHRQMAAVREGPGPATRAKTVAAAETCIGQHGFGPDTRYTTHTRQHGSGPDAGCTSGGASRPRLSGRRGEAGDPDVFDLDQLNRTAEVLWRNQPWLSRSVKLWRTANRAAWVRSCKPVLARIDEM